MDESRKLYMSLSVAMAVVLTTQTVAERKYVLAGWPNVKLVAAFAWFAIATGLYYRKVWSRWLLLAVVACAFGLAVRNAFSFGPTIADWLHLVCSPYVFWDACKMRITRAEPLIAQPIGSGSDGNE